MSHDQFCLGKELVVVCHVFTIFLPFWQMFFFFSCASYLGVAPVSRDNDGNTFQTIWLADRCINQNDGMW